MAESTLKANEWRYEGTVIICHACAARRRAEGKLDDLKGAMSYARHRKGGEHP